VRSLVKSSYTFLLKITNYIVLHFDSIPVEFLSAVDQCIEIPQLGIIRSLNVHVTGAIAIWKFTEQMMRKNK
jgi:tRNA guanosine-2'-O-methyltransferase